MQQIKRMLDFFAAAVALFILSPLFLLIAILIKLDSKGPVFFRQKRAGQFGKPFEVMKFRSMVHRAEQIAGGAVTQLNSPLVTRLGKFLRLSSLDELPQFINVLRGEMSFVGPRPLLAESIRPEEMRRLDMKPGITGLVQVEGRQSLSWDKRMERDLWYVDHWSLWLDLQILFRTIPAVFFAQNVYDSSAEMKVRQ